MADDETTDSDSGTPTTPEEYNYLDYQSLPADAGDCTPVAAEAEPTAEESCPTCVPNPNAPNIDWTKTDDTTPFLNERKCTYSIAITTKYQGTGGDKLQSRLNESVEEGVIKLLAYFDKALDENTIAAMVSVAGATDHYIPPRPLLKMKALIEIDANDFDKMPSSSEVPIDSTTPTDEDGNEIKATPDLFADLNIEGLEEKMKKVTHGFMAYARHQAVFYKIQRGTVTFPGGQMVNLMSESNHLKKVYPVLSKWLRQKGWVLRESRGKASMSRSKLRLANRVQLGFDGDFRLIKVIVYQHGTCEDTPTEYEGMKISSLKNTYPFDRPTTLAFLPNIDNMIDDLTARQGMKSWTDFTKAYVYPVPTIDEGVDMASTITALAATATGTATTKDMETLTNSAVTFSEKQGMEAGKPGSWDDADWVKQGNKKADAFESWASGKAKAAGLDSTSRRKSGVPEGAGMDRFEMEEGQTFDDWYNNLVDEKTITTSELAKMACDFDGKEAWDNFKDGFMDEMFSIWDAIKYQFQGFICMTPEEREEMLAKMQEMRNQAAADAFAEAVAVMIGFLAMIESFMEQVDEIKDIKMLYPMALDEIKLCGLFDLLLAFIECLAAGFELDEMLQPIIAAALKNMGPLHFEKLFIGLPPEAQAAVKSKVEADLGSHMMPWDAYHQQGKPDPAGESSSGSQPHSGTVVTWGKGAGGLSSSRAAARQDPNSTTPKIISAAREFEDKIKAAQEEGGREVLEEDDVGNITYGDYLVSESVAIAAILAGYADLAATLADYIGSEGVTAATIQSSANSYTSQVQALINEANSSSTVELGGALGAAGATSARSWSIDQQAAYNSVMAEAEPLCQALHGITGDDDPDALAACIAEWDAVAVDAANAVAGLDDGKIGSEGPYGTRGSLGAAAGSAVSTLLSAYAQALLDYYVVAGLEDLMKELEKLPGAELVAKVIAMIDCIMPPMFDPPLFDFLKTLELDFCNNQYGIVLPRLVSLPIPNFKDFFKYLLMIAKEILLYILFRILLYLLTKILMLLFDSICKALQALGELAGNAIADAMCNAMSNAGGFLGDVSDEMKKPTTIEDQYGRQTQEPGTCQDPPRNLWDMIKEGICGPDATDEQAKATTNNMAKAMGGTTEADAAKMANEDAVNQLITDMSSVLTGNELTDLLLGNSNPGALTMVQEIVKTENPDYTSALGSKGQIKDFFKMMGDMLPMEFRAKLRDEVSVPAGQRPANPTLCTSSQDVERFKALRRNILMGKEPYAADTIPAGTTKEQADQQFDAMRGRALNDLEEVSDILQGGLDNFVANALPPILGEPDENGCVPPNALIPREPEEMMDLISSANESITGIVNRAYRRDVNGRNGILNMILCDTNGLPYKRHQRKNRRNLAYVDHAGEALEELGFDSPDDAPDFLKHMIQEHGQYPKYIAQYLREYLWSAKHLGDNGYVSTTEYSPTESITFDADLASIIAQPGGFPIDERGNIMGTEDNPIIIEGEKVPDLVLKFRDNNKGFNMSELGSELQFSEGFNLEYLSYIIEEDSNGVQKINTDNVYQLNITDVENEVAVLPRNLRHYKTLSGPSDRGMDVAAGYTGTEDDVFTLVVQGSLPEETLELKESFDLTKDDVSPQANLWNQYLISQYQKLEMSEDDSNLFHTNQVFLGTTNVYDHLSNTILKYVGNNIADNEPAFLFGYDPEDDGDLEPHEKAYYGPEPHQDMLFMDYVTGPLLDQLGDKYLILGAIPNMRKLRKYIRKNQIMGTSKHERMHFLSPAEYGGRWMSPPYYIEPSKGEGWLGIRDALVPEVDGQEPKRYAVCNFKDIKDRVDELNKKVPDDPRLSECPDCVKEFPYSRILDRAAAAGMEGPILSMMRVYVLEEMLKAMPMFSNFKALIPEVLDYTYVEYILAQMKEDFTENLGRARGFLKGDALWYTFLEQCVQSYGRRIQLDGLEPPLEIEQALEALNNVQADFHYPTEEDLLRAQIGAGANPWEDFVAASLEDFEPEVVFNRKVLPETKLAWYRRWHLLQAVKDSEEQATIIVRAMIEEQLEFMAQRFEEALAEIDLAPEIDDIYKFFIGSSGWVAGHREFAPDLNNSATPGEVFDVAGSSEDNPLNQYQDYELEVTASVELNSDTGLYSVVDTTSRFTEGEFILEKYIRVTDKSESDIADGTVVPEHILARSNSVKGIVNIDTWKSYLQSAQMLEYQGNRLSEFFGDLEFTYGTDEDGNPIEEPTGIDGSTGVRYGLRLSYIPPREISVQTSALVAGALRDTRNTLTTSPSWSTYQDNAEKEKALFLPEPVLETELDEAIAIDEDEDGMPERYITHTPKYTITRVVTRDSSGNEIDITGIPEAEELKAGLLEGTIPVEHKEPGAQFIIPLAYAEYDALDHTIGDHINNIQTEMDLTCLANDLIETPEFKLLFHYVFPLNRLMSLMGIYVGRSFLMSIGEKTAYVPPSAPKSIYDDGMPVLDEEAGEWQNYATRRAAGRHGMNYDRWDFEFLFRRTKRRLVRQFRAYFKSREFLSDGDDDGTGGGAFNLDELDAKSERKDNKKSKKKGRKGSRKKRRRRRERPFDKNGGGAETY